MHRQPPKASPILNGGPLKQGPLPQRLMHPPDWPVGCQKTSPFAIGLAIHDRTMGPASRVFGQQDLQAQSYIPIIETVSA